MSYRKLSQGTVDQLLAALEDGDTRRAAAAVADIDHATLYRWMAKDATLRDKIEKAEAIAEHRRVAIVRKAGEEGNWQAAAWWLERRKYEDYARRERVEMSIDIRGEARKLAQELGLDEQTVIEEAEAILAAR